MKTLVFFISLLYSAVSFGISSEYVDKAITAAAYEEDVPPALLKAICYSESRLDPYAYLHQDSLAYGHAFGVCQVLYKTAKRFGFEDPKNKCTKSFHNKKSRIWRNCKLFGPKTSAKYAAKVLAHQLKRYNSSYTNAIAAYNSGSIKACPARGYWFVKIYSHKKKKRISYKKTCTPGGLINQAYVDRVMEFLVREVEKNRMYQVIP